MFPLKRSKKRELQASLVQKYLEVVMVQSIMFCQSKKIPASFPNGQFRVLTMMSSVRPTVHHEISILLFPSVDVPRLMKPILEQDQLPKIARNFPIQNLHFNFPILSLTCVSTRSSRFYGDFFIGSRHADDMEDFFKICIFNCERKSSVKKALFTLDEPF